MILLNILLLGASMWLGKVIVSTGPGELLGVLTPTVSLVSVSLILGTLFLSFDRPLQVAAGPPRDDTLRRLLVLISVLLVAMFILKLVHYQQPPGGMDRGILLTSAALDLVLCVAVYISLFPQRHASLGWRRQERRVLIIGSGSRARRLTETLTRWTANPVYIVGYLDPDPTRVERSVLGYRILGTMGDISTVLKNHVIDEVVMAIPRAMISQAERIA